MSERKLPARSTKGEVDAFLQAAKKPPRQAASGRLLFAMDATASREPTWDQACKLQADMFSATDEIGGLAVQLCYYRGYREFEHSDWMMNAAGLARQMTGVRCLGGATQILRVFTHAQNVARQNRLNALVFVGDCMEEDIDQVCNAAGQLSVFGVPAFMFQEGNDPAASRTFSQVAQLTRGAHCHFNAGSAQQLRDLLRAVAVYASGGNDALKRLAGASEVVRSLTRQLPGR